MTVADVLANATHQQVTKISKRIGMDPRSLGRVDSRTLAPWIARTIAEVLGVPVDQLFRGGRR
jgi:hypothetical protein